MLYSQHSFKFAYIFTNVIRLSFLYLRASTWEDISSAQRRACNISLSLSLLVTYFPSFSYMMMKWMHILGLFFLKAYFFSYYNNTVTLSWYLVTFGNFSTKISSNTTSPLFPPVLSGTHINHVLGMFTASPLIISPSLLVFSMLCLSRFHSGSFHWTYPSYL